MYFYGRGVQKSEEEAVRLWRLAAEEGHSDSQYNMGWAYQKGNGVEKSKPMAREWYTKAADQGHEKARKMLRLL
jgi:hypothetical protein